MCTSEKNNPNLICYDSLVDIQPFHMGTKNLFQRHLTICMYKYVCMYIVVCIYSSTLVMLYVYIYNRVE